MPLTTPLPPAAAARVGVPAAISAILAALTYVLVAALAPPAPVTGTAGYEISQIRYEIDPANALRLEAVTFVVGPAGRPVPTDTAVRLTDGGSWYPCQFDASRARCSTPDTEVSEIAELSLALAP